MFLGVLENVAKSPEFESLPGDEKNLHTGGRKFLIDFFFISFFCFFWFLFFFFVFELKNVYSDTHLTMRAGV